MNDATPSDTTTSPRHALLRWGLGLFVAMLVVLGAALAWLTWNDWNRSRAWVSQKVSQAIGRDFEIRGPLDIDWQWPQQMETGWRRWVPPPKGTSPIRVTFRVWTSRSHCAAAAWPTCMR